MPAVTLMFFASVFQLSFPLLDFRMWNGNDLCGEPFETLKGRFWLRLLGRCRHGSTIHPKRLFNQTVLHEVSSSVVGKVPVGFEIISRRLLDEMSAAHFVQVVLVGCNTLSRRHTDLLGFKRTIFSKQQENLRFKFGTL